MFPNSETTRQFLTDHFRKRRTPLTEDAILDAITAPRSKYDVYWGVLALRDFGTARSIPALKGLLHYSMQDVKDCSLLTIAHIAGASETPFYLEALADKGSRKAYPMWAIEIAADERAVPAVLEFVNAALRKAIRPKPADPGDAYISGLKYFARVGFDRPEIQSSIDLLKKAWAKLPEGHRTALRSALPSNVVPE
jgi:hypothetical protein